MTTITLSKVTANVLTALVLTAAVTQSAEAKMKLPWQPTYDCQNDTGISVDCRPVLQGTPMPAGSVTSKARSPLPYSSDRKRKR